MGNLQIKNLPDDLHDRLRERAEASRMTVRDYVLRLLERDLGQLTWDEWFARYTPAEPIELPPGLAAELVQEGREERARRILGAVEAAEEHDAPYRP